MPSTTEPRGLHRFTLLTALATLFLISVGGMVTSHGAGMAVPDWPNTYGYNMFFFPFSSWIGGIFYEHSHRLAGSLVGLLTVIQAAWFYGHRARPVLRWTGVVLLLGGIVVGLTSPKWWQDAVVLGATGAVSLAASFFWPRREPQPRWLRRLALLAVALVILQGVLGGLRVTLFKDELGIFHATLAQLFFVLTGALALFTSKAWPRWDGDAGTPKDLVWVFVAVTLLVLGQLILGATMRHQHAGLAVPDFPLAYGKLWPATDAASVAAYNRARLETTALNDITAAQIVVHMAHRLTAVALVFAIGAAWWLTRRKLSPGHPLRRWTRLWLALVLVQFALGAWTIWSNKAADVATLHVVTGALTLLAGSLLTLTAFRLASPATSNSVEPRLHTRRDSRSFA